KYGSYGPYISYQCYRGRYEPDHPRPYMVSERDVLPWVQAEVARLEIPATSVSMTEDPLARDRLVARRQRVIDNYEDGLIDKTERDRKLVEIGDELERTGSAERVMAVPAIDWSWDPDTINQVLRSVFDAIVLGTDLRPIRADWAVPEWRAA
ncbi:MAG TPA: hypothetical protein VKR24_04360, partial [Candidatus Limnocylindrales bacterium]|nr:hypothetical protein [Candidatus Limnocylindrales bacterium]